MEVEKHEENGKIAVLISVGYGTGWSTQNPEYRDFFLYDKTLVALAAEKAAASDVESYIIEKLSLGYVDVRGWDNISTLMINQGTPFRVVSTDGYESIDFDFDPGFEPG